jgi:diadenylate cyclase
VLQRAEMTKRMAAEIDRDCIELGAEARLIRMQLQELVGDVPAERAAVVRDYHADGAGARAELALEGLRSLPYRQLLESERLVELLGYSRDVNALDHAVTPRGFRILSRIRRLPESVIKKVVAELGDLESIVRASQRDLEAISGVGAVRAREIREGLRRLQEHNLVDRYLQL